MNKLLLAACLLFIPCAALAEDMESTPFQTGNQSPLVMIYGLPRDTGADIVPTGVFRVALNQDLSSNFSMKNSSREQIKLDGETYRLALTARYGIAPRWEVGVEVPYLIQGGGFLDDFVVGWHKFFQLPQGGRDRAAKNRINFSYSRDGVQKLKMDSAASGVGDIILMGGYRLYDEGSTEKHDRLALKGTVKFPTGESRYLLGSGSTDATLQFCGSMTRFRGHGALSLYGSAGGVVMTKSDVLRDQHNQLAGVGTLGVGWGPASWISFKVQLNGSTALYHGSSLDQLSRSPLLLLMGGALKLPGEYLLDIGVGEDLMVSTTPDVSFHLGLSKQF